MPTPIHLIFFPLHFTKGKSPNCIYGREKVARIAFLPDNTNLRFMCVCFPSLYGMPSTGRPFCSHSGWSPLTQHLVNLASRSLLLESCSWQNASWQETKQQQQQQPQQCITIMPFLLKGNREDFWIIHYSR